MGFRLTIAKGVQEGREITFEGDELRIGRAWGNDVVLPEPGVSRRHARIFRRGGRHYVADQGSGRGTRLNGRPVGHVQELRGGDRLEIGPLELLFTPLAEAAEDEPTQLDGPRVAPQAPGPSAAGRARLRRQLRASLGGRVRLGWRELSPRARLFAGGVAALALALMLGLLLPLLPSTGRPGGLLRAEPSELRAVPLPDSFGLGEGVTWEQPDLKAFHFEFVSPTRVVAVLHYQARDISRPREVSIHLNGAELGWVPADSAEVEERELQLLLPGALLRREGPNRLVFDNVLNPPAEERWRIWNVYVEVIPVPELPAAQLLAKAREEAAAARRFHQLREVGSENLFKAWKLFRSAWITLEALERKPELHGEVIFLLAQTARELDQACRGLMLDFQRSVQYRDGDRALATLQEVLRRFPTPEHRCHNLAFEKALEYELPI